MVWFRLGDNAITHPVVMAASRVSGADTRTRNELFGFVSLLGTMSSAHLTDSVVEEPAAYMAGGPDTDRLVAQAVECGLLVPHDVDGRRAWRIVQDPDLMHVMSRAEVEWNRTRKRDNSDAAVNKIVQRRDGSACRYCGQTVNWNDRRGGRGGTYDHLKPGQTAASPADKVVCCRSCNSARGAAHRDGRLDAWDTAHPLRPVPSTPHYCDYLAGVLDVPATTTRAPADAPRNDPPAEPTDNPPENMPADIPAPDAVRPDEPDTAADAVRPHTQWDTAADAVRPDEPDTAAESADDPHERDPPQPSTSHLGDGVVGWVPGTGRVGSGRAGQGRSQPARRRRKPRSRPARPGSDVEVPSTQEE